MDSTRIGSVLLTLALALPLAAGAVDLAPGAPERYTVKRGDTLWDIAGHYLREPWHWPKIWRANPQVRDPDRIYPGDVLTLEYVDGKPVVRAHRVQHARRPGVVKLSPGVRETPIERAIPLIPVDAIDNTLRRYCAAGADISSLLTPTPDHLSAAPLGMFQALDWLDKKFAGLPTTRTC